MSPKQVIFKNIQNAILDLQRANLQSYELPLKKLGKLLNSQELREQNLRLTEGLDLTDFLKRSEDSQAGTVGSARLFWPESDLEILGMKLLLIRHFSENPGYLADFGHHFYYSGNNKIISGVHDTVSQIFVPFLRDYKDYILSAPNEDQYIEVEPSDNVFVVHGHDDGAKETVARFISTIGFQPIILHEQANQGMTIIEKIEANSNVSFAVVLLTPDDRGNRIGQEPKFRARQNVLLELGYFMGRLGRSRVCALRKGDVEIPSDFAGVVWQDMDDQGAWKFKLAKELQASGHDVDLNRITF